MKSDLIYIKSISELARLADFPPVQNPVFGMVNIAELTDLPEGFFNPMVLNFYTIGLKKNLKNPVRYGRTNYDFNEGVLGFTAPQQVMELNPEIGNGATGWMIFFQTEFIKNSVLYDKIDQYGFFDYQVNEGLHLSEKEERTIEQLFESMYAEYDNNMDRFSHEVILSYLELILNYSNRFYSRQFITRNQVNKELLIRFSRLLKNYFQEKQYETEGLPTVTAFAEKLNLSQNYLGDYLKSNTGKSTQEHIHLALIEKAKALLLGTSNSISEIAYDLGFEYPPYFSRLFKAKTGYSPKAFRVSFN